jgi:protein-S-isoprenylcysteine O-methyltransferase Ste14
VASALLYFLVPQMNLIIFPINLLGVLLLVLGNYLVINSHYLLKKRGTPENFDRSTCVVETGLYKYSRNPMYLGAVIFLIGWSVLLGNIISFLSPIIFFIIINWMFIPFEEEKMEKELGDSYLEYKKKTRRWF